MKIVIILGLIAIALFFIWICCVISGKCSKREEKWEDLYEKENN